MDIVWQRLVRFSETPLLRKDYFPSCFGASHRASHKNDLAKLDVEYPRLMRMVVGPPANTNLASPWHDILHGWNNKVAVLSDYAGLKPWSVTCIEAVWTFASYVATLPTERWTRRTLEWNTMETRTACLHLGNSGAKILHLETRWQLDRGGCCVWSVDAIETRFEFVTLYTSWSGKILHFVCLRPKGAAFGPARFDLTSRSRCRKNVWVKSCFLLLAFRAS